MSTPLIPYPPILVVGKSGSGKSFSIRNLDPKRTTILNEEDKVYPVKNAIEFEKKSRRLSNNQPSNFFGAFDDVVKDPETDVIIVDSFTAFSNRTLTMSKQLNKGYEIYNYLNDYIEVFLTKVKQVHNKWVVVFGIDELVEEMNPNGTRTTSRRCFVNGKQWEAKIEEHFTLVFFTDVYQQDKTKPTEYKFIVNNDGTNSAKSPPEMFNGAMKIDNDLKMIIDKASAYWNFPAKTQYEESINK